MTSSTSSSSDHYAPPSLETKSLLPQHTRPRNIHSPRKSITRHQHQPFSITLSSSDEPPHHSTQPLHHHQRRCRILISTLFISTTLLTLISLFTKFIIFPYLLPTPTPILRILSLSLSNSSSTLSARLAVSNPTYTSTFHFSDSAYTIHFNSKPISETNPNLRLQIPPQGKIEIAYDMTLERNNEEMKRGLDEMVYRVGRGEEVRLDMTVYLYGSSAIRPWSFRMVALFYDCVGIRVDFPAVDGGNKSFSAGSAADCQLVEKLTS